MTVKTPTQNITIRIIQYLELKGVTLSKLKKLVKSICRRFKISRAVINIVIVDNARIRKLNRRFLNRRNNTDCLSFDLSEKGKNSPVFFELAVNAELAAIKAKLLGHRFESELALYIVHSMLHNLGFNDSCINEAKKMHRTEDRILQQSGFGAVYNKKDEP